MDYRVQAERLSALPSKCRQSLRLVSKDRPQDARFFRQGDLAVPKGELVP
jgi:hypothetical protein